MPVKIDTLLFGNLKYRLAYMEACIELLEEEVPIKKNTMMEKEWKAMKNAFDKINNELKHKITRTEELEFDSVAPVIITRYCRRCKKPTPQKQIISLECTVCNKKPGD